MHFSLNASCLIDTAIRQDADDDFKNMESIMSCLMRCRMACLIWLLPNELNFC